MPLLKEEAYTIDDIYALPDGERAELIDGRMYMMAPPSRKHQRISTRLVSIIDRYIEEHKASIEDLAKQYLTQKGFGYGAALQLLTCYFPARAYGSMVFPCGFYDAVRIILGKGEGHNWWCVLYPRFCFTDGICSEVPSESVKKLQEEINQDDFLSIKDRRPDIIIRLRLFPEFFLRLSPDENQSLTVAKPFTPH